MHLHVAHFYEPGASSLVMQASQFLADALSEGDVALVAAQCERLNAIQHELEAHGFDCRDAAKWGRIEFLDGQEVLAKIMFGGRPDPDAFERVIGEKVREMLARRAVRKLHIYGELVGILWRDGNDAGAVELERLWNRLLDELPAGLYCGYPMDGFDQPVWSGPMEEVLSLHTRAVPESFTVRSA
jgi:MEDS: MEthanogen/methylotroph, DcmR Sensory domain